MVTLSNESANAWQLSTYNIVVKLLATAALRASQYRSWWRDAFRQASTWRPSVILRTLLLNETWNIRAIFQKKKCEKKIQKITYFFKSSHWRPSGASILAKLTSLHVSCCLHHRFVAKVSRAASPAAKDMSCTDAERERERERERETERERERERERENWLLEVPRLFRLVRHDCKLATTAF